MTDYEKAVRWWQSRKITTDAELAEALNGHSILFAYHSGKIENENITYHDTREIFEHDGVTSYTGDLRTLFEIRNAKDANELLLEMHGVEAKNALTAAAYFHVKFENIHPFADGNGRAGRLAMNYLLLLLDHPSVIIHEEDRKEYYAALEAWDTDQDLDRMKEFLKEQTVKTWQKQLDRNEKKHDREC